MQYLHFVNRKSLRSCDTDCRRIEEEFSSYILISMCFTDFMGINNFNSLI